MNRKRKCLTNRADHHPREQPDEYARDRKHGQSARHAECPPVFALGHEHSRKQEADQTHYGHQTERQSSNFEYIRLEVSHDSKDDEQGGQRNQQLMCQLPGAIP
ncbi:hypothetical protein D3C81_2063560 [compost metagenome]